MKLENFTESKIYIKKFEIKSELSIPNDEGYNLYFVICKFLEEIKPEIRYIVIKNYPSHLSKDRGLAFSFGSNIIFSLKIIKRAAHNAYIIELNNRHQMERKYFQGVYEFSQDVMEFIYDIFKKYLVGINTGSALLGNINTFEIPELDIKKIIKELNQENFELYTTAKKYNL